MKKLIATTVVAVMMAAGLVVASGGVASAGCSPSQYAGCFKTRTSVTATKKVPRGTRATICVTVTLASGSGTPNGTVLMSIKKKGSTSSVRRQIDYYGGKTCMVTRRLNKKGKYHVTALYRSPAGSVFYDSLGRTSFKVKR